MLMLTLESHKFQIQIKWLFHVHPSNGPYAQLVELHINLLFSYHHTMINHNSKHVY
jgi:hypothetical protein